MTPHHQEMIAQHIVHQAEEGTALPTNHAAFVDGNRRSIGDRRVEDRRSPLNKVAIANKRVLAGAAFERWLSQKNPESGMLNKETYPAEMIAYMRISWRECCNTLINA